MAMKQEQQGPGQSEGSVMLPEPQQGCLVRLGEEDVTQ